MEDLRDNNKKIIEEGKGKKTFTDKNSNFLFIKKYYKLILIFIGVIMLLLFPNEIGYFIGHWIVEFRDGLMNNFK